MKPIICPNCSKEFLTKDKRSKFCSKQCYREYQYKEGHLVTKCDNCSKELIITKNRMQMYKKHYCNDKCKFKNHKNRITSMNWTEKENELLKKFYPFKPSREVGNIIGRSYDAVNHQAMKLGLRKDPNSLHEIRSTTHMGEIHLNCNKRKPRNEASRKKRSELSKRQWADPNSYFNSELHKLHCKQNGERFRGMKRSREVIEKNRQAKLKWFRDHPEAKIKSSQMMKERWQNKDYRERVLSSWIKSLHIRPSSFEQQFMDIIKKYNLDYKYVGNGEFFLGFENPDFINNNGKKIAIEVFWDYFKKNQYGSVENFEKIRSENFKKYGYKTIFFNGKELDNTDLVLKKIREAENEL